MAKILTPIESFVAPLARITAQDPDIEGHVFWGKDGIWPDAPAETLEAEEIAFYVEGLLVEGFCLIWQAVRTPEDGAEAILLYVWQGDAASVPNYGPVLSSGVWPALSEAASSD